MPIKAKSNKILINDTIQISHDKASVWLEWMQNIVIPGIQKQKEIHSVRVTKIMEGGGPDGITFACQYICPNTHTYSEFINNFDIKIQQEQNNRFQGHFGTFRTVMEIMLEG